MSNTGPVSEGKKVNKAKALSKDMNRNFTRKQHPDGQQDPKKVSNITFVHRKMQIKTAQSYLNPNTKVNVATKN